MKTSKLVVAFMFLLSACAPRPAQAEVVVVKLSEFQIQASRTSFEAGKTYRFVIENTGALAHEFSLMTSASMEGHDMSDMGHDMGQALLYVDDKQLAPGKEFTIEFTFPEGSSIVQAEFACHLPGHYDAGMFVPITIA